MRINFNFWNYLKELETSNRTDIVKIRVRKDSVSQKDPPLTGKFSVSPIGQKPIDMTEW